MDERQGEVSPEALFAPGELSALLRKVFGAIAAHPFRLMGLALLMGLAAYGWTRICPRVYTAKASVFALPGDGSSGAQRGAAGEIVGLSDGAARVMLSDGSLEAMVDKLSLTPAALASQGLAAQWLAEAREKLGLTEPEVDPQAGLLAELRQAITVKTQDAMVDITVEWRDPTQARAIAQEAVERLFAARHEIELSPLEAKVDSLTARVSASQEALHAHRRKVSALIAEKRRGAEASTIHGLQASGRFRDLPDPALVELRQRILAKRRAVAELEEVHGKRLAEVRAQLAEQSATLGPRNPLVIETRERLGALEDQGRQLASLQKDEQRLLASFVRRGGNARELEGEPGPLFSPELETDDPRLAYEKAALSSAMAEQQGLTSDLLDARLALESARTTFEARYLEMVRPLGPLHPSSPRTTLTTLAALLVGLFTALLWSLADTQAQGPAASRARADHPVPAATSAPAPAVTPSRS
jgi:uncharacterized protein involved in exopolysaccharide biosynthesis